MIVGKGGYLREKVEKKRIFRKIWFQKTNNSTVFRENIGQKGKKCRGG